MGQRGGARPGAGRKTKAEELQIRNQAIDAIEQTYGSITEGLKFLLASREPALIKFAWAHAIGNPKDVLDVDMNGSIETLQIIQLPDNGRDDIDIDNHLPSAN
jgi:hypothetical protein